MTKENTHRIGIFESLRGALSFGCFSRMSGLHTAITSALNWPMKLFGLFNGTAGFAVYVFMILSGFVIFFLLDKGREGYFRFIFRRFFRLYPVFMLAFVVGIFLNPMQEYIHSHASWKDNPWIQDQLLLTHTDRAYLFQHVLTHIPMLHGMVPDNIIPRSFAAFSGPGWSISVEWQFYLVAPFLFLISRRLAGMIAFGVVAALCLFLPWVFPAFNHGEPMRGFLVSQLHWFFLGTAFFYWYKDFPGLSRREAMIRKVVTVLVLLYLLCWTYFFIPIFIWLFFYGLVVWNRRNPGSLAKHAVRLFDAPWLQYLGQISYPVYLLHWPIIIVESRLLLAWKPQIDRLLAYPILLVTVPLTTVLVAHFVHLWIELPTIQWARDFWSGKRVGVGG